MNERIIFEGDEGLVSIIIPDKETLDKYGIHAIAKKDVPIGRPYKIISAEEIPADRTFRSAWEVNVEQLTDGFGEAKQLEDE